MAVKEERLSVIQYAERKKQQILAAAATAAMANGTPANTGPVVVAKTIAELEAELSNAMILQVPFIVKTLLS
jgi:hypothetical protein